MGLMDKVRAQGTQIAQMAQETAREGKVKLDQAQAKRRADACSVTWARRCTRSAPGAAPRTARRRSTGWWMRCPGRRRPRDSVTRTAAPPERVPRERASPERASRERASRKAARPEAAPRGENPAGELAARVLGGGGRRDTVEEAAGFGVAVPEVTE